MSSATATAVDQARRAVEQRQAEEDALRDEYNLVPDRLAEAEAEDTTANNKAHAKWIEAGGTSSRTYPPRPTRQAVAAVERRIDALPKEISGAKVARLRAVELLESLEMEEAERAAEPGRSKMAEIDRQIDQLRAEREEVQKEVWEFEGRARRHQIAMYGASTEATGIELDLKWT